MHHLTCSVGQWPPAGHQAQQWLPHYPQRKEWKQQQVWRQPPLLLAHLEPVPLWTTETARQEPQPPGAPAPSPPCGHSSQPARWEAPWGWQRAAAKRSALKFLLTPRKINN
ncbi:hypothetical protein DUNSADRAFT_16158 [Dunaliella salina]|uniref:Encoded protein n=1 Tax=Dunaliella salina TaxID=3046 RepID=A0ABQ7G498_DUNSA|nr:hypothetical protein DUNSADRAFT_16158 [Dunaliella salina]|eukprot:KAF5829389.1 hypothetical protein DUNSADRAFT_16158 [Dunaliella salina]